MEENSGLIIFAKIGCLYTLFTETKGAGPRLIGPWSIDSTNHVRPRSISCIVTNCT